MTSRTSQLVTIVVALLVTTPAVGAGALFGANPVGTATAQDTTAPTITNPQVSDSSGDGIATDGEDVTISADVSDNVDPDPTVTVDTGPFGEGVEELTDGDGDGTYNTTITVDESKTGADGDYNLTITANDTSLNVAEAETNEITIDSRNPPEDQVFDVTNKTKAWERSIFPLRADTADAKYTVDNANWFARQKGVGTQDLNKDPIGVYENGTSISITFDDGRAVSDTELASTKVQLIAARLESDSSKDISVPETLSDAANLLTKENANENTTMEVVGTTQLDSLGDATFTFTPSKPGQYTLLIFSNESDDGPFKIDSEGNITSVATTTLLGVEHIGVQRGNSSVTPPSREVPRGTNATFTARTSGVISKESGENVGHAIVLYDEDTYTSQTIKLIVDGDISTDLDVSNNTTIEHSIEAVQGVADVQDPGKQTTFFGVNVTPDDDGLASGSFGIGTILDDIADRASTSRPQNTSTDSVVLNGSVTVVNGSETETIKVRTLDAWPARTYRWIHVATNENGTELATNTGTLRVRATKLPVQLQLSASSTSINTGNSVTFTVTRNDTNTPVENATITVDGSTLTTGSNGQASRSFSSTGNFQAEVNKSDTESEDFRNDTVTISVSSPPSPGPTNSPPNADAGNDRTVDEGTSVTLDATGSSDPDGDSLSYSWSQTGGPSVSLSGSGSATPTFTAPTVDTSTTLTFEVSVSDGNGGSDTDSVSVTVEPVNDPPVADAGDDQSVLGGDSVTLDATGSSDPDGDTLSYSWSQTGGPSVSLSGASTATPSFTAPGQQASLTFEVTVTDGQGGSDTDSVTVTVTRQEVQLSISASAEQVAVGETVEFTVTRDDTGDTTSATVTVDGTALSTGADGVVSHAFSTPGTFTATATKTSTASTSFLSDSVSVTVTGAPNIEFSDLQVSPTTVEQGEPVTVTAQVENTGTEPGGFDADFVVDGDPIDSTSGTLDPGESRTLEFETTFETVGPHTVTIDELDPQTVTVVGPPNIAFSDLSVSPTDADVGETVTITATVENTGGQPGPFTGTLVIDGEEVDVQTGTLDPGETRQLTFQRTFDEAGEFDVTIDDLPAQTVSVTEAAEIEFDGLTLSSLFVDPGATVTISATVQNVGGESGPYNAGLVIDGEEVDVQTGTLDPGESTTVEFERTFSTPGRFEVGIDGLTPLTLTVNQPANIEYSDLSVSPTEILAGETVSASATVTNTGGAETDFSASLVIDGRTVATRTGQLGPGESTDVSFEHVIETPGTAAVTIDGLPPQLVTVRSPSDIQYSGLAVFPRRTTAGQTVTAIARVQNRGDLEGEFNATFTVDGEVVDFRTGTLDGGGFTSVRFQTAIEDPGDHELSIGGLPAKTVTIVQPATFELDDLVVSPTQLNTSEIVTASVEVTNVGQERGPFAVDFVIDDEVVLTRRGVLEGGASQTLTFRRPLFTPGDHTVTVGDLDPVTVSVTQPDLTNPTIALESPGEGPVRHGTPLDFDVTDDVGLESVQLERNTSDESQELTAPFRVQPRTWAEGPTSVTVTATDTSGNVRTRTFTWTFVSQPRITNVAPTGTVDPGATLTAQFTDPPLPEEAQSGIDPAATRLFIDGEPVALPEGAVTEIDDELWELRFELDALDLESGTHPARVVVADNAGNDRSQSWTFAVDQAPPSVSISAEPAQDVSTNNPTTMSIRSQDANPDTTELVVREADTGDVVFTEDLSGLIRLTGGSTSLRWTATQNRLGGPPVASGEYELAVRSTDAFGQTAEANTTVTVDNAAPTISITSPADDDVFTTGTVEVTAQASGTPGDPASVTLSATRLGFPARISAEATQTDGTWSATLDLSGLPDGRYRITGTAVDAAGNSGSATGDAFVVLDTQSPTLAASINTEGTIRVRSSERLPEPPAVTLTLPDGSTQDVSLTQSTPTTYTGSVSLDQSGTYTIEAVATDFADNEGTDTDTTTVATQGTTNRRLIVLSEGTGIFLDIRTTVEIEQTLVTLSQSESPFAVLADTLTGGHFIDAETGLTADEIDNITISIPAQQRFFPRGATSPTGVAIAFYNPNTGLWVQQPTRVEQVELPEFGISGTYIRTTTDHLSVYGLTADDTTAPSIDSTSPSDGASFGVGTSQVTVEFQYSDDGTGVNASAVELAFDGNTVTNSDDTTITTSSATYEASGLGAGSHTATVTVVDEAGNSNERSITFSIAGDDSSPELSIDQPADGETFQGTSSVNLAASYEDPQTGIDTDSVTVELDGTDVTSGASISGSGLSQTLSGLSTGEHTVTVSVDNGVGSTSTESATFTIAADQTPPSITFESPTDGQTFPANRSSVAVSASLSDVGTGVDPAEVQLFVDGIEVTPEADVTATSVSHTITGLVSGTNHTVTINATDEAGRSNEASVEFAVAEDTTAPTVSVDPADGETLPRDTSSVTVSVDFADDATGVDPGSVSLLVDGRSVTDRASISAEEATVTVSELEPDTSHGLVVGVTDNAGNRRTSTSSFDVGTGADITVVDATLDPSSVLTGEPVTINATVENFGTDEGTLEVPLLVDGEQVDSRTVTVGGGEQTDVTFTRTFDQPGDFEIRVESVTAGTVTVQEPVRALRVDSASVNRSSVRTGEAVAITATVRNIGELEDTFDVSLERGGEILDTQSVTLGVDGTATVTFVRRFDETGTQVLTVNGASAGVVSVTGPQFATRSGALNRTTVLTNEAFAITATVQNTGTADGTLPVGLYVDGEQVASQPVTLSVGAATSVSFVHRIDEPGSYSIRVADRIIGTVSVVRPTAALRVTSATLSQTSIQTGQSVDVTATVQNVETVAGRFTVGLEVDGSTVATRRVQLAGGATTTVTFSRSFSQTGSFALSVNGTDVGTVTVEERRAEPPDDDDGAPSPAPAPPVAEPEISVTTPAANTVAAIVSNAQQGRAVSLTVPATDATRATGGRIGSLSVEPAASGDLEVTVRSRQDPPRGDPALDADRPAAPITYFEVTLDTTSVRAGAVIFNVSVSKDRLSALGAAPDDVVMYRLEDGDWNELPTSRVGETATAYRYEVRTTGLSVFALGAKRPRIEVTGASLSTTATTAGSPIDVTATVENTGGADGSATIELTVDGSVVDQRTVSVPAGETRTVTVPLTVGQPGTVDVAVDGVAAGTLTVNPTPTPTVTTTAPTPTTTAVTTVATTSPPPTTTAVTPTTVPETPTTAETPVEEPAGPSPVVIFAIIVAILIGIALLAYYRREYMQ